MKVKDRISDNYRKQVDEILDNQSDLNLFDPLSQEETDEIWEEVSVKMDIDEVWTYISSDLEIVMPSHSGSGIILKSVAAFLIILIGMIPVKKAILESGINQPDILIENELNEQSAELVIKNKRVNPNTGVQVKGVISPALKSSLDKSENDSRTIPAVSSGTGLTQEAPIPASNEVVSRILACSEMADSNLVVSPDKIPMEKSDIPPALFPGDLEKIELLSKTDLESLKKNDNSSAAGSSLLLAYRGRISGGLITLVRNTWLLNYETLDGFRSESLNTTEFVYFPDVGLSMNYSINKTWSLQADGFFSSNTGQEYLDYIYGHYSRKKITLNYSMIDFSVKHKFISSGNLIPRFSINILAGGYVSFLNYAYQKINTDLENIGSHYGKFDFGVRLGGEFELQIFDQLSLAPGLSLSIGIPNIYKGDSNIPGYLRRTHNGSAGFHLAIYYHFN